jgi:menaquinone-dependent protoporphyrinogen oxidase
MRVVVTYASKHGSTEQIARCIADRLRERAVDADARPIADVKDLGDAEVVVLGSAVYMGSWMKEASQFAQRHRDTLARLHVWLFSSGPTGPVDPKVDPKKGWTPKQIPGLVESIAPRAHRVFPGALDANELGFFERKAIKMAKAPEGDFRNWDEIRAFADEIADSIGKRLEPRGSDREGASDRQ